VTTPTNHPPVNVFDGLHTVVTPLQPTSPAIMTNNYQQQPSQSQQVTPTPPTTNTISDIFANIDLTGVSGGVSNGPDQNVKPFVITTQEFGRRWGTLSVEMKQSTPVSHFPRLDLEILRRAMPSNYHHVESIPTTQEAIFAATATTLGAIILVHMKLQPAKRSIDILVKCNSQEIAKKEVSTIGMSLISFRG
jgi:hypothetical protein